MPLLKTYAGGGVALAKRAAALNAPVVCNPQILSTKSDRYKNNPNIDNTTNYCKA
jgi:hypothetical protein